MSRHEQRTRMEGFFRNVNERMRQIDHAVGIVTFSPPAIEPHLFFCECGELKCMAMIKMSPQEYDYVRDHPARFVVLPGHSDPNTERVVQTTEYYEIVEKYERRASRCGEADRGGAFRASGERSDVSGNG